MTIPKFLTSSVDAEKLALTIKGILIGLIPVIMMIANLSNVNLGQEDLTAVVDAIIALIQGFLTLCSLVMIAYGAIRKIRVKLGL